VVGCDQPGRIDESDSGYSIQAAFPVLAGEGAAVKSANRAIRDQVEALIASFRTKHQEEAAQGEIEGAAPWTLDIEYDAPYRAAHYLAVLFIGYDFRGGAHGMPISEPLVIALADGRRIPPAGLFRPDADWLGTLAARCYAELKLRDLPGADEVWLRGGTEPKADNYRQLVPGPDGLRVIFPPYAVAPYAVGTQEVLIPYPDLSGILYQPLFVAD
jgi:hypothetical protein